MSRVLYSVGVAALIGVATLFAAASSANAKTAKACEEEWKANKETIKASGKKKKDFIAECRAEAAPGAEAAQPKAQPSAPEEKPAETAAKPEAPESPAASAPPAQPKPAPAAKARRSKAAALKANEFASEAEAKGRCPGATVVWANTRSKIFHYAGHPDYGRTKQGAFMCESDTAAAGIRAAKDEKHP